MKEYKYIINGNEYNVSVKDPEGNIAEVEVNGAPYKVELTNPIKKLSVKITKPAVAKASASNPAAPAPAPKVPVVKPASAVVGGAVKSPLPGLVLDIVVKMGDTVKVGQHLMVLEAMKMENVINSDRDGVVTDICVTKGQAVLEGAPLVVIG